MLVVDVKYRKHAVLGFEFKCPVIDKTFATQVMYRGTILHKYCLKCVHYKAINYYFYVGVKKVLQFFSYSE